MDPMARDRTLPNRPIGLSPPEDRIFHLQLSKEKEAALATLARDLPVNATLMIAPLPTRSCSWDLGVPGPGIPERHAEDSGMSSTNVNMGPASSERFPVLPIDLENPSSWTENSSDSLVFQNSFLELDFGPLSQINLTSDDRGISDTDAAMSAFWTGLGNVQ